MFRFTDTTFDPAEAGAQIASSLAAPDALLGDVTLFRAMAGPPLTPAALTEGLRRDQSNLTFEEQEAFKNAVTALVQDGAYAALVADHMDMSHRMHGAMMGQFSTVGLLRFLPWHRRYLVAFEGELQRVDRSLRPDATEPLTLPYWRWTDPFPEWLEGFLPAPDPATSSAPPSREKESPPEKPTEEDLETIVEGFAAQLPANDVPDYVRFTWGLEGWGRRPDGSSLPAHNHVHDWVGGIMSNPMTSPTDPIFWLHHAEVDRLWHVWQQANPGEGPPLQGVDRVLDPWPETVDDVAEVTSLGVSYDRVRI